MKPIALVDCDGVLANFSSGYIAAANEVTGNGWTVDDITHYSIADVLGLSDVERVAVDNIVSAAGWVSRLEVLPDAQEGMQHLARVCEVFIVTSLPRRWHPHWVPERMTWLERHFGIDADHMVFTKAKERCHGDVFVDDDPDNVRRWKSRWPAGHAVLWAARYNAREDVGVRTSDWRRVRALVTRGDA